tara:strand:- start:32888 stop:33862 length:975 start_codon:yes stop_codon:yes gene_type:complete
MKRKKKILITGSAGFIGFFTSKKFLDNNFDVIGIDNLNNYYDIKLKKKRINILKKYPRFKFKKININNFNKLNNIVKQENPETIINLAAQAGVRYSIDNPEKYFESNLKGFFNLLEISKINKIKNILFASTSSVYGKTNEKEFHENQNTDFPIQFYAATKKSNEVMAYSYAKLFKIKMTCLRFFTVYGPWGRPDMSYFKFANLIKKNKKIEVYNYGKHSRSFTYINDITDAIFKLYYYRKKKNNIFEIFNLGSDKSIKLKNFINILGSYLNKKVKIKYLPLQEGDVVHTKANINKIKKILPNFPKYNYKAGLRKFIDWHNEEYK